MNLRSTRLACLLIFGFGGLALAGDEEENNSSNCDELTIAVRNACVGLYQNGVGVDCHGFVTQSNTALKFYHESTSDTDVKRKTAEKMCARTSEKLVEALAEAEHGETSESCGKLGKHLETQCFDKLGQADYNARCSGWLIATKNLSGPACAAQLVQF